MEWVEAIDIPIMLDVAMMIARAALFRTESRGAHYREDYPKPDNENWLHLTLINKEDGEMVLSKGPVNMTRIKPGTEKVGPYWKPEPVE